MIETGDHQRRTVLLYCGVSFQAVKEALVTEAVPPAASSTQMLKVKDLTHCSPIESSVVARKTMITTHFSSSFYVC